MSLPHKDRSPEPIALRAAQPADAALLCRWRSEPSVRQFQPLGVASLTQLRAELVRQNIDQLYRGQGEKYQWIVSTRNRQAGWITLVVSNWDHGLAEIGYALSTKFQGRGIMAQALTLLLADVFGRTRLERIEARCAVDNTASQRVLDKVGFRREGRLRGYFLLHGKRVDNFLYAILRSDFLPGLTTDR